MRKKKDLNSDRHHPCSQSKNFSNKIKVDHVAGWKMSGEGAYHDRFTSESRVADD